MTQSGADHQSDLYNEDSRRALSERDLDVGARCSTVCSAVCFLSTIENNMQQQKKVNVPKIQIYNDTAGIVKKSVPLYTRSKKGTTVDKKRDRGIWVAKRDRLGVFCFRLPLPGVGQICFFVKQSIKNITLS